uniref:BZIP domain-containing protein n=1 Tax=Panagrellus redivivus TaxID=6233 RepID=A0A7E4USM3_PANRE
MEDPRPARHLDPNQKTRMIKGRALAQKKRQGLSNARSKAAKASHKARASKAKENKEADESSPTATNGIDPATAAYLARGNANIINSMDAFYKEVNYDEFTSMLENSLEQAGVDMEAERAKMAEIEARVALEPPAPVIGFMSPPAPTTYAIPATNNMYPIMNAPTMMVMSTSTTAYGMPTNTGPSTSFILNGNYETAPQVAGNQTDDDSEQYKDEAWTIEALKKELVHKNKVINALKKSKKNEANKRPPKTIASFKTKALRKTRLQELYEANGITPREAFALVPASLTPAEEANIISTLGISEHRRAYLKRHLGDLGLDILAPTKDFHEAFEALCYTTGYTPPVEENEEFLNESIQDDPAPPTKTRKRPSRAKAAQPAPTDDHEELD